MPATALVLASMGSTVGLLGLLGIAVGIFLLYLRRKQLERGVDAFHAQHRLTALQALPPSLRDGLGSARWACYQGGFTTPRGPIHYYWLEGGITSVQVINQVSTSTVSRFVAIALPPGVADAAFIAEAESLAAQRGSVKDWFVLNTERPIRATVLADGHFLLVWNVCVNAAHYEQARSWVRERLARTASSARGRAS